MCSSDLAWLDIYAQHGGTVDQGVTFQAKDPGNSVEPCPLKNQIARVDFLTGNTPVKANAEQWVNLPQHRRFVDGVRVAHLDRLGHTLRALRIAVQRRQAQLGSEFQQRTALAAWRGAGIEHALPRFEIEQHRGALRRLAQSTHRPLKNPSSFPASAPPEGCPSPIFKLCPAAFGGPRPDDALPT